MKDWSKFITMEKKEADLALLIFLHAKNLWFYEAKVLVAVVQLMVSSLSGSLSSQDYRRLVENLNRSSSRVLDHLLESLDGLMDSAVECGQLEGIDGGMAKFDETGISYFKYVMNVTISNVINDIEEEGFFVPHCDDAECGLGTFKSTCLNCDRPIMDYDIWWRKDEVLNGREVELTCRWCEKELNIHADKSGIKVHRVKGWPSRMGVTKSGEPLF